MASAANGLLHSLSRLPSALSFQMGVNEIWMIREARKPGSKATSLMRADLMLICNQGTPCNGIVVC